MKIRVVAVLGRFIILAASSPERGSILHWFRIAINRAETPARRWRIVTLTIPISGDARYSQLCLVERT